MTPGMETVENGYLIPPQDGDGMTITDARGVPVRHAMTSLKYNMIFPRYLPVAEREDIPYDDGRYLFCGFYFGHFGHFMFESLSRLWAYEQCRDHIDGLVFFNRGDFDVNPEDFRAIFDHMGIEHPIRVVRQPLQCAAITVPAQGVGLGAFASGLAEHRAFMKSRMQSIAEPATDVDKIYLSRTRYKMRRGSLLSEHILEQNLEAQGYQIFHPQLETLERQVAVYRGATKIIGPDSSALHIVGFVAEEDQEIAIILRRKYGAADLLPQLAASCPKEPLVIDAIKRTWAQEGRKPTNWGRYAQLSFEKMHEELLAAGFISADIEWRNTGNWVLKNELNALEKRFSGEIIARSPDIGKPEIGTSYF